MLTLLIRSIRAFIHGRDAAVAIIVAISLPIVLGIGILAIDYSMALVVRSENQRSADTAVYAAAMTYGQTLDDSQNALDAARAEAVHLLGMNGVNPDDLTLNLLPEDDGEQRLELLIAQDLPPIGLISLRGPDGLRVVVRSVAQISRVEGTPPACMRAVNTSGPTPGAGEISLTGSVNIELNGCDVVAGERIRRIGNRATIEGGQCRAPNIENGICSSSDALTSDDEEFEPTLWSESKALCDITSNDFSDFQNIDDGEVFCFDSPGENTIMRDHDYPGRSNLVILSSGTNVTFQGNPQISFNALEPDSEGLMGSFFNAPQSMINFRGTPVFTGRSCGGFVAREIRLTGTPDIRFTCPFNRVGSGDGTQFGVRILE